MKPPIVRLGRVASTLDIVHSLAEGGAVHGTAIVADEQEGGRGSRGRSWLSPRGGLWLSSLFKSDTAPAVEVLSLRVGLAVAAVVERVSRAQPVRLKWPNDLMLADRKLGGVLCEARWQGQSLAWVAIGIGINVANAIPEDLADRAIALAELAPDIQPGDLAEPLARAVCELEPGEATELSPTDLAAYAARDWLQGRALLSPEAGTALGIAPDGALLVTRSDGSIARCRAGSVVLQPVSARP